MLVPPPQIVYVAPPPRRSGVVPIVVLVVLAILVALLGGVVLARQMNAPTEVALEPVATAGADAFMPSIGTDAVGIRPVANTGGRYSGGTPGLYGGSGDDAVCDRTQLSRFLGTHPDMAAGWAAVLGVGGSSASQISSYVAGLTPVVLRSDTFVTNHGWSAGDVTSYPAVLQAGTAVLVDAHGTPVTRCFCGNPLTVPSSYGAVAYFGTHWSSFSSTSVTVITRSTTVTDRYTIVDVRTGEGRGRPAATTGDDDTAVVLTDDPLSHPGTTTDLVGAGGDVGGTESIPDATLPDSQIGPTAGLEPGDTSPATSSASTGPAPEALLGDWHPGAVCQVVHGLVTFTDASGYDEDGLPAGTYTWTGTELTLTPTSGSTSVVFDADSSTPTTFTSAASGSCVLSSAP